MKNILPDDLPNMVIVYDSQWKISKINASAISLLGYSKADELIGKPFKDILHESEHGATETFCRDLENKKSEFLSRETRHLCKDGRRVSIFSQFGIIRGKQGTDEGTYIQSGFCTGEETMRDQELKNLHFLEILAENVPGLMMLVIDGNLEILCSLGSEKKNL